MPEHPAKIILPRLLLVSGTGRNSGKTTLACSLIERHKKNSPITAIKIAPHYHHIEADNEILVHNKHYQIIRETMNDTAKDSSKMLKAGAREVFYVQTDDESLQQAFKDLQDYLSPDDMYICESGGLRHVIKPGVFLMIHNQEKTEIKKSAEKLIAMADQVITRQDDKLDFDVKRIYIEQAKWKMK